VAAFNLEIDTLERLSPGTALRQGLERILQMGKGALIVLGSGKDVDQISSGGFRLQRSPFSSARLAELAKMDGGIVLDSDASAIVAANVHFVPDPETPTDETGSRHRTAQRIAIQTGRPVVAVSEGRHVATLYIDEHKIELPSPAAVAARVNQELLSLDRLRRQLDEAESLLTQVEVADLVTYRSVVTLIQRAEMVRRVGAAIGRLTVSLGDEGHIAAVQLNDLLRGVEYLTEATLRDYVRPRRPRAVQLALAALRGMPETDLIDPTRVARAVGFGELDDPAEPLGVRILGKVGRLPESVRDELMSQFPTLQKMLRADPIQLEAVDGIGNARANQIRHYFDRLLGAVDDWTPSYY
jgi:diadenylate cyclase